MGQHLANLVDIYFFLLILLYCYTNSTVCSDFLSSSRNPQISCSCLESIKIWNRSNSTRTIIEIIPKRPSIFGDSFLAFKYKIERIKNEGKRGKRRKKQNLMPYENLFVYHPKIKSNRLTWKEVCDWRNWSDIESIRRRKKHIWRRARCRNIVNSPELLFGHYFCVRSQRFRMLKYAYKLRHVLEHANQLFLSLTVRWLNIIWLNWSS